jgi:CubicO group peptidase (beta-lactamase class C family)
MKKLIPFLLLLLIGCDKRVENKAFTKDLKQLQAYFNIPGISVIVTTGDKVLHEDYMGFADVENRVPMDSLTTIPMASLTKMFSAMLILRLADRGVLDQPVKDYIQRELLSDSIKVKHILSHTSQGIPGRHYYYSGRFNMLTKVIEKEYGSSFKSAIDSTILLPLQLNHTYLLNDSSDIDERKIAKPYVFEGSVRPGFLDEGYSASAGIVSTVRDIAKLSKAIDNREMFTARDVDSTYGYGVFVQEFEGERIIWAYGQYDCYSSLFMKVPSRDLTFVVAANNNLMSDPARLIYGDVTNSLFALSFIRHFVTEGTTASLDLKETKARALSESFMARYDSAKAETSRELLRQVFRIDPDVSDLAVLHNLNFLKEVEQHYKMPVNTEFDHHTERIARKLLNAHADNPYANYYLGNYYNFKNAPDSVRKYFRHIADAKNFDAGWCKREAEAWLRQNASSTVDTTTLPLE